MQVTENDIGGSGVDDGGYELQATTVLLRRLRKRRWTLLLSVAFVSMGVLSYSASGNFTAAATVVGVADPEQATLMLDALGATGGPVVFSAPNNYAGETVQHRLDVAIADDATALRGATMHMAASGDAVDDDVRVWVSRCSEPWDEVAGAYGPRLTCTAPARQRDVLGTGAEPVQLATSDAALANLTLRPGARNHLRVQIALPPASGPLDATTASEVTFDVTGRRSQAG
jgi:hypothetical protein